MSTPDGDIVYQEPQIVQSVSSAWAVAGGWCLPRDWLCGMILSRLSGKSRRSVLMQPAWRLGG
jgi:hypothetical protein